MSATPVIAIFDIGKTNKKLFLFDEEYRIVYEKSACFSETVDEDGDPCESLETLHQFVFSSLQQVFQKQEFAVKAVNVSAYGASFVHLDEDGVPVTPLYNYLKNYPAALLQQFYATYGGEQAFSITTASPVLGHLNSGLQLYWLKYQKPLLFKKISHSLHLPQYISYLLSRCFFSDLTSIGCHTALWDFTRQAYHEWVQKEDILEKLPPVVSSAQSTATAVRNGTYNVGVGLHDSSAALIPYLASFSEPFLLLSTGTWCISLNPFNASPLTAEELAQDCLCYLTYEGKPVKASRLFAGNEHEQQTKRLAEYFGKDSDAYKAVRLDKELVPRQVPLPAESLPSAETSIPMQESVFGQRQLESFASYEAAYHQLVADLVQQQVASTQLVLRNAPVQKIFVDGGFGNNPIYMHLLASAFPDMEVYAAKMAQASALGAALAIHSSWNEKDIPIGLVELKRYLPETKLAKAVTV